MTVNKTYWCPVCKDSFVLKEDMLDEVQLTHEMGEELTVTTCNCSNCESMLIVEGMNRIGWLLDEES